MGSAHSHNNDSQIEDLWWRNTAGEETENDAIGNNENALHHQQSESYSDKTNKQKLNETPSTNKEHVSPVENNVGTVSDLDGYSRSLDSREKLEIFKKHLESKRIERQTIIKEKKREMEQLRLDLEKEKQTNQLLRDKITSLLDTNNSDNNQGKEKNCATNLESINNLAKMEELVKENIMLKNQIQCLYEELKKVDDLSQKNKELQMEQASLQNELQSLNKQIIDYEQQKEEFKKHIIALKDIIKISKQMILLREGELQELKQKIACIEKLLADHEMNTMSNDLRKEYERQLRNIRNLRTLYEERARISRIELKNVQDQLTDAQQKISYETNKNSELQQRVDELEEDVSKKYDDICSLESNLGLSKAECRELQNEMGVINQLFAQFLLGFNTPSQDLDKLVKILEENHDLLADINLKDNSNDDSSSPAFPRLLLNLINQIGERKNNDTNERVEDRQNNSTEAAESQSSISTPSHSVEEIVTNLPKVWRVLTELLSHQAVQPVEIKESDNNDSAAPKDAENPCYKSVETPAGTRYEPSVSKTYIRLKDLILEKKYLQKEMSKMKSLNKHLEDRLRDQETRLLLVTTELSKTWHIVGRLQRQSAQLHTHEKILRYELSQKRKLLNELKEELEYCKEKWEQAREKNNESEHECHKLRSEFASRRCRAIIDDSNNSAESGYSDEQEEIDDTDTDDVDDLMEILQKDGDDIMSPSSSISETGNKDIGSEQEENGPAMHTDLLDQESNVSTSGAEESKNDTFSNHVEFSSDQINCNNVQTISNVPENSILFECGSSNSDVQGSSEDQIKHKKDNLVTPLGDNLQNLNVPDTEITEVIVNEIEMTQNGTTLERSLQIDAISNESSTTQNISQESKTSHNENFEQKTKVVLTNEELVHTPFGENFQEPLTENLTIPDTEIAETIVNEVGTTQNEDTGNINTTIEQNLQIDNKISNESPIVQNINQEPKTSHNENFEQKIKVVLTNEELIQKREERFKRLEEHCKQLKKTYLNQTERGTELCVKLDTIHQQYGGTSISQSQQDSSCEVSCSEPTSTFGCPISERSSDKESSPNEISTDKNCNKLTKSDIESNSQEINANSNRNQKFIDREERFKRLDEQCKELKAKYTKQTKMGTEICSRLDTIHEQFGRTSTAPSKDETKSNDEECESQSSNSCKTEIHSQSSTKLFENSNENESNKNESSLEISSDTNCDNRLGQNEYYELESTSAVASGITSDRNLQREERFKRLDEQCKELKTKYAKQTEMGTEMCSRLDTIHEQFAGNESENSSPADDTEKK